MVTAIVLIQAKRDRVGQIAQALLEVKGITEVYSVAGHYDLVAIARVPENQALAELVTRGLAGIESITRTETLIAFQTYSKHDLERLFSIGLESKK